MGKGNPRRTVVLSISLVLGTFIAWTIVWHLVGPRVTGDPEYRLTAESLEIPPQPSWIHADIRAEVLRGGGLDRGVSALDDNLAKRVYDAFRLHPWVERVDRVTKAYPSRLRIDLVYRRPVCIVEVPGGTYVVDAHSVVLPSADFAPNQAANFPRLIGVQSSPQGEVGGPWGDGVVSGGARLAALLIEDWRGLNLDRIVLSASQRRNSGDEPPPETSLEFDLFTRGNSHIHFGVAPAGDLELARKKLAWLKQQAAQEGGLDGGGSRVFDLRQDPYTATPLTALRPE